MDLFENFILFDRSGGKMAKILARNHQYLGVNEAVESYKNRKLKNGKLGVFWHTQGSGKTTHGFPCPEKYAANSLVLLHL